MSQFSSFKSSSVSWLVLVFILYSIYMVFVILRTLKTKAEQTPGIRFTPVMEIYIKVMERDMVMPIFMFAFAMQLGAFFPFMAVFGYFMLGPFAVLFLGHLKRDRKLKIVGKILNSLFIIIPCLNIFANDLKFTDAI